MMFRCISLIVMVSVSCALIVPSLTQNNGKTFLGEESYAFFPPWLGLSMNEGAMSFTFRTTELNGLLLYAEGNGSQPSDGSTDYIVASMDNGVIYVMLQFFETNSNSLNLTRVSLGGSLNDNRPHTFSIRHSEEIIEYSIDSTDTVTINYSSPVVTNIGTNGIYLGGLPSSVTPVLEGVLDKANFVGCLESLMASNNSQQPTPVLPLGENNVREGCVDPCNAVSCSPGVCIPRWPDRGFCDCSGTSMSGENCNEEASEIELRSDTYFCYTLMPPIFGSTPDTINIQLAAPLPTSGTVMTGQTREGDLKFALYLDNSRLVYELTANNNEAVLSVSSQQTLSVNLDYQVTLVHQSSQVNVTVRATSDPQTEESFSDIANGSLTSESAVFESVCIGGGLLEVPNYVGIQRNVFYNYNALLEDRNFDELITTCVSRTDHIHFNPIDTPPLTFRKQTLANRKISFEVRTEPMAPANILLEVFNNEYQLIITTFNGNLASLSNDLLVPGLPLIVTCQVADTGILLNDGQWHRINIVINTTGLGYTIDENFQCNFAPDGLDVRLNSLANEPLHFGPTSASLFGSGVAFGGCFQNFEFTRELNSESFRPNLDVVINSEDRFDDVGCFNCSESEHSVAGCNTTCECVNSRFGVDPYCLCPGEEEDSCPIVPPPNTTTTMEDTTPTPPDTTSTDGTPPTTADTSTTTQPTTISSASLSTGEIAGIVVGVLLSIVLLFLVIFLLVFILIYSSGSKQGFYKTHESNGKDTSMLRYRSSLRELSSQTVTAESNGTVGSTMNNNHDKEFYL